MSSPISSQFPNASPVGASAASAATAVDKVQPVAQAEWDTVQLTVAQRVYQLHTQGQRVWQIAVALNLSEAAVNRYLNISSKS